MKKTDSPQGSSPSAPDAAAGRERRRGGLLRKLAAMLLGLAVVSVVLSAIFTYTSTRDTYLASQAERLVQVGDYAVSSVRVSEAGPGTSVESEYETWLALLEEIDPARSYAEETALFNEAYTRYEEVYNSYYGQDVQAASDQDVPDDLQAAADTYNLHYTLSSFYSLRDMLDRLAATFSIDRLALLVPNEQAHTAVMVAEGVSGERSHADAGAYRLGDAVDRPASSYPGLWEAVSSGEASTGIEVSPDGSLYTVYVPLCMTSGTCWVVELSIESAGFTEAIAGQMTGTMLISTAVLVVCLVSLLLLLRRTLVRPLSELSERLGEYAASKSADVADKIRAHSWPRDEAGILADGTASMIDEIGAYVRNISLLSSERERVRSELAVASRIQVAALPTVGPAFKDRGDFGLSASMHPAKAVGGDFYDFFLIDEKHVGIVIADVSDKGVPAALFMMRSKATIKQFLGESLQPAEAMARANDELCLDNDGGMFVTVWLGVLDLESGELAFACGGHNPPVYRHADGRIEWLTKRSGLVLGTLEGMPYKGFSLTMEPGDLLVLYTDGVTEAMDAEQHCFGEKRLESLVAAVADTTPDAVTAAIEAGVHAYSAGTDQSDDITLLSLRFLGAAHGVQAAGVATDGEAGADGCGCEPAGE